MQMFKVTDETTRAELEEAIGWLNQAAKRIPTHWVDHKARAHARIDALLDEWERTSA